MERIAAQSAWTGMNRFDSFAPLRVNVAAQWLVDGVSLLIFALSEDGSATSVMKWC
jgi:hypothetical protein